VIPAAGSRLRRAYVLITAANVVGGLSFVGQKLALEGLPPATVTLLRNLVAIALLGVLLVRARARLSEWTRAELGRAALIGVLAYAAPLLLGIWGVQRSSAANASILVLVEPCAILLLSWLLLRERLGHAQIAGVGLGLVGALCVVLEGGSLRHLFAGTHLAGNAMLALHAFLWGLYSPLAKPLAGRRPAAEITFCSMLFALCVLVPASLGELARLDWGAVPLAAWGWTLALGIFVSHLGTLWWVQALEVLPASHVAPFLFLQPLVGVLVGIALLGERLSPAAAIGCALIAGGVALCLWPARASAARALEGERLP
jgi:drug/metabolite transporter (DMT)-like permease